MSWYTVPACYYAIFHAIRAVNTLDSFDSSKHSGVIAHFNQFHVKTEEFPSDISKKIANAMNVRQLSDYDDFYVASKKVAEEQVRVAEEILGLVEEYLNKKT
ncbi:HEPN domain-containing protein [Oribacterium sp. KHPX15]|uniref:HEPN domain-containing protein n=1 Tax=Oribacterium sp. KHPX15 TaxID=1855342 RepID=UPI000B85253E|nr:HEPN domain-containing protein [Oribacterium sp. KHPX15]